MSEAKKLSDKNIYDTMLIAMYTGCRIEEITQLETDSIIVEDGIRCINIKKSKTKAGIRKIPIHQELISDIEKMLKNSKDGYLIQTNCKNKEIRSSGLSKKFGILKRKLGYDSDLLVFHSIRKTVATILERATAELKKGICHFLRIAHSYH